MALSAEMDDMLNKISAWSASKTKELQELNDSHKSFFQSKNDATNQLKHRERIAQEKLDKIGHASEQSRLSLAEVQAEVQELIQTSKHLPQELEILKSKLAAEKENLMVEEQELEVCQRSTELKRRQLETGHEVYEKNLGLRFERQREGLLVIKMYNIDPQDHSRQFYFTFRVEEDNLYNVCECVPPLADLPAMVRRLNDTNNLSHFVRSVRRAWVTSCNA